MQFPITSINIYFIYELYLQYENPSFIDTWTRINTYLWIKRLICLNLTHYILFWDYVPTSATPSPSLSRSLSAWSGIPSPSSSISSSSGVPSLSSSWSSKLKQTYALSYGEDMKLDSKWKKLSTISSQTHALNIWPFGRDNYSVIICKIAFSTTLHVYHFWNTYFVCRIHLRISGSCRKMRSEK